MRVREPAGELLREDWSCCGEIVCVEQSSGSIPALQLAVLTLQCAAKPHWWLLGQPAHAATHRSSPVEWCNRFVSFGLGYALSWSGVSSCWVGWGVSRDLVRMSRLR